MDVRGGRAAALPGARYCRTNTRSASIWMSLATLRNRSCGTWMPWAVKVEFSLAFTLTLSLVKPKRFCCSTCSGESLMYITVASPTVSVRFCLIVSTPCTLAGASCPGCSAAVRSNDARTMASVRITGVSFLALLRRHAERRVARAARLPAKRLHDGLRRRLVAGLRGVAELLGLGRQVFRGCLEVRPFGPDLGLGRGFLRIQRAQIGRAHV